LGNVFDLVLILVHWRVLFERTLFHA